MLLYSERAGDEIIPSRQQILGTIQLSEGRIWLCLQFFSGFPQKDLPANNSKELAKQVPKACNSNHPALSLLVAQILLIPPIGRSFLSLNFLSTKSPQPRLLFLRHLSFR